MVSGYMAAVTVQEEVDDIEEGRGAADEVSK